MHQADRVEEIERSLIPSPDNRRPLLSTSVNLDRRLVMQQSIRFLPESEWKTNPQPFHHNRELFLFNDLLLVTERCVRVNGSKRYQFCQMLLLTGVEGRKVCSTGRQTPVFGIQVVCERDNRVLLLMSSRCEEDRNRIFDFLKESIIETRMTDAALSLSMNGHRE